MVRVTCLRCGRTFSLTNEQIVMAVEASRDTKRKHYVVDCPHCRHTVKAPMRPIFQAYKRMEKLGILPTIAPAEERAEEPAAESAETNSAEEATE